MARRCAHEGCPRTISHTSRHRHCAQHRHEGRPDTSAIVTAALAADPGFAAALERETDRSLARDPERWRPTSAAENFSYAARSGDEEAIARSVRARERVARSREESAGS